MATCTLPKSITEYNYWVVLCGYDCKILLFEAETKTWVILVMALLHFIALLLVPVGWATSISMDKPMIVSSQKICSICNNNARRFFLFLFLRFTIFVTVTLVFFLGVTTLLTIMVVFLKSYGTWNENSDILSVFL